MNSYYKEQLIKGTIFQDKFIRYLNKEHGWGIKNFKTKQEQIDFGENPTGIEIKFDDMKKDTGNLWIEMEERSDCDKDYYRSGIFRPDNTWLYIQGDYKTAYAFAKKQLQFESTYRTRRENKHGTSIGFILPIDECNDLIIQVFDNWYRETKPTKQQILINEEIADLNKPLKLNDSEFWQCGKPDIIDKCIDYGHKWFDKEKNEQYYICTIENCIFKDPQQKLSGKYHHR